MKRRQTGNSLVQTELCAKGNLHTRFQKNQYEKNNVKYMINKFEIYYVEMTPFWLCRANIYY